MDNRRFECRFSEKAMKYNPLIALSPFFVVFVPLTFPGLGSHSTRLLIITGLVVFSLAVYTILYLHYRNMSKESYLEITDDGQLKCVYKGRSAVSYPIKEIKTIEEASCEQAEKRYAMVPVVLNIRGIDVYPENGVLISFNRAWFKSVFPVFFNPADIQGFMSAVIRRMEIAAPT